MASPTPSEGGSFFRTDGLAIFGLFALAVVVTWPLLLHMDDHVVGPTERPDSIGNVWHVRWFAHCAFTGANPYQVHTVLYPVGAADFIAKSGPCFGASLTVPLQLLFDSMTSYNIIVLLLLAFTGYGGYRLTHYLVQDRAAAFVGGALWLFAPLVHAEIAASHVEQFSLGWCLLALLYLLRTLREPGWRNPIAMGFLVAITTLSYMGYALLLGVIAPALLLWEIAIRRHRPIGPLLARIGVSLLCFSLLVTPVIVGYMAHQSGGEISGATGVSFPLKPPAEITRLQMTEQIIYTESIRPLDPEVRYVEGSRGLLGQLPFLTLCLALLGAISARRRALLWMVGSACFVLLSFGPYFLTAPHLMGPEAIARPTSNANDALFPLPGLLLYNHLPLFTRFRFPYRFLFMFWIFVSPLVAFGVRALMKKVQLGPQSRALWATGICIALLAESVVRGMVPVPAPLDKLPPVPSFYSETLANEPDCALLSIPFQLRKPTLAEDLAYPTPFWQSMVMYYHSVHHKRIVDGIWVAFSQPEIHARFIERNSLLRNIHAWQTDPHWIPEPIDEGDLWAMERIGFRYAVVHTHWLRPRQAESIGLCLDALFGSAQREAVETHFRHGGELWIYDMTAEGYARKEGARGDIIDLARAGSEPDPSEDTAIPSALEELQAQYVRNPDDVAGWTELAGELERRGRFGRALDVLDEAATWAPADPRIEVTRGQLFEARGIPQLALAAYEKALSMDPDLAISTDHLQLPAVKSPVQ